MPKPINVLVTKSEIIWPDGRASRPITILEIPVSFFTQVPKAAANFTASMGVSASSTFPPIVPLIPEMDLINVTI
jgi:hypothetical protein